MTQHDTDTLQREQDVDEAQDDSQDEAQDHAAAHALDERHIPTVEWLESEFPEWEFEVDSSSTGEGEVTRWVARKDGHHQQAELSAGKLQRRLSEYMDRQGTRDVDPGDN